MTELVGEIAIDSNDQVKRIYQINSEIGQIDQITQSNTANADETAATAQQLAGQTTYLEELLTSIKVEEEAGDYYMVNSRSKDEQKKLPG